MLGLLCGFLCMCVSMLGFSMIFWLFRFIFEIEITKLSGFFFFSPHPLLEFPPSGKCAKLNVGVSTSSSSALYSWFTDSTGDDRIMSLTNPFPRCGGCDGHSCHGNTQVQSWDGPEGLLQSLPLRRPSSDGGTTHLHAVTLDWPRWLPLPEVWSLRPPLTCPDQVTCCRPIRQQLHLVFANCCFWPLKQSMKRDSSLLTPFFVWKCRHATKQLPFFYFEGLFC